MFHTYILECADNTLYTGYTNNLEKRLAEHNGIKIVNGVAKDNESKLGAKYTKARRPVILKYSESFDSKSEAMKREIQIKKLTRQEKLDLIKE